MAVKITKNGASFGESDAVVAKLKKTHGEGIGGKGVTLPILKRSPTGIFQVDLSIGGGFPQGKFSLVYGPESSGKTNLTLLAIAHMQSHCDVCGEHINSCVCEEGPTILKAVFIDVENSFDPEWSSQLGVNVDDLIVITPDYAEQAVDIIEAFAYSADVGIIVVDSIAALIVSSEIEKSADSTQVGGNSIIISKLVRKLNVALGIERKRGHTPTIILINQIRTKIGVMFGNPECLHGDSLVNFVDGRSLPIKEVVNNKIFGDVWSYNPAKGWEGAPIKEHFYNGKAQDGDLVTITVKARDTKNGVMSSTFSKTHKVLTPGGWKEAKDITVLDKVVSKYSSLLNGTLQDFLVGAVCGDLTISTVKGGTSSCIRIEDSQNKGYAKWKAGLLSKYISFKARNNDTNDYCYVSNHHSWLYDLVTMSDGVRHPKVLFNNFSWLGFCIWILDDACYARGRYILCVGRFKNNREVRNYISKELDVKGLKHSWNSERKSIVFDTASSRYLAEKIAEYVPECMHHKIPEDLRRVQVLELTCKREIKTCFMPVRSSVPASLRKYRDRGLYDLHVGGWNNYSTGNVDNGFIVHNCLPGGFAPKFHSSMTLRVYGKDKMVKEVSSTIPTFKEVTAIVQKWKCPIVAKTFEFEMCMIAHNGIGVGESNSWNTAASYLKNLGLLGKTDDGKKFVCLGTEYQKLGDIESKYRADTSFKKKVHDIIITSMTSGGASVLSSEGEDDEQ